MTPSAFSSLPQFPDFQFQIPKDMFKFKVFTDKGSWLIEAESVNDAFRKALWFCWRDGEDFHHMESDSIVRGLKYHLCAEDKYGIYKVAIG